MTPRKYLSWSSMDLFERDVERWKRVYLYDEQIKTNRGMDYGRKMADGLEHDEATGDIILDLVMERIPKFEIMDKAVECVLPNGKNPIQILIKPDTMKADGSAFKEYKTGQTAWTKSKADKSGQISFYATGLYLKFGKIPRDIELVYIPTEKLDKTSLGSKIGATGDVVRIPTTRSMADVLNMMVRMKKCWEGIQKICEEELL